MYVNCILLWPWQYIQMGTGYGYPVGHLLPMLFLSFFSSNHNLLVQDTPDPNDPATWMFQLQTTGHKKPGEDVTSLENLKKKAETFAEPFRSANLWIPEGTKIYENNLSYWIPVPWDTRGGRILIAGDAAHPMTFRTYFQQSSSSCFESRQLTYLPRSGARNESWYCRCLLPGA